MKKNIVLLLSGFFLLSCNNSKPKNENKTIESQEEQLIGGQEDAHGCLPSAGESWSQLRQSCLQIFNEGIRLNPVDASENESVISAFVLFDEGKTKAEIFLPNDEENIILEKKSDNIYQKDNIRFDDNKGILYISDKETYRK